MKLSKILKNEEASAEAMLTCSCACFGSHAPGLSPVTLISGTYFYYGLWENAR